MVLASIYFTGDLKAQLMLYPLAIAGMSIVTSIIGTFFVRLGKSNHIMGALYKGVIATVVLSLIGLWPLTDAMIGLGNEVTSGGSVYTGMTLFWPSRQRDVLRVVRFDMVPRRGVDRLSAQSLEREWSHKSGCGFGHGDRHPGPGLRKPAHDRAALVRRDTAGHADEDVPAVDDVAERLGAAWARFGRDVTGLGALLCQENLRRSAGCLIREVLRSCDR